MTRARITSRRTLLALLAGTWIALGPACGNSGDSGPGDPLIANQVSSGGSHTCALVGEGNVASEVVTCWGDNALGQSSPPEEPFAGDIVSIAAGERNTCAVLVDGSVPCWGDSLAGQNALPTSNPAGTILFLYDRMSAGGVHICGVRSDVGFEGQARCAGDNTFRQVGGIVQPGMGLIALDLVQISAGGFHTCGLKTDDTAVCWGRNTDLQTVVPAGLTFSAIAAGADHSCGIVATDTRPVVPPDAPVPTGEVVCWGRNDAGETDPPAGVAMRAVSAGLDHTCGIRTDDTAVCWGSDQNGQSSPPDDRLAAISAGSRHNCGLDFDGAVICWGNDVLGQSTPPSS